MQKIDIDEIIEELKKYKEWNNYTSYLGDEILYSKKGIDDLLTFGKNTYSGSIILPEWKDRESLVNSFKFLEDKFIELFLDKYHFCPYCGKHALILYENYEGKDKRFFDLDHIFPKNSYNHLTYNFYNLIPSCKLCNQAKSTKNFITGSSVGDEIFHPYFGYIRNMDKRKNKGEKFQIGDDKYVFQLNNYHGEFFKLNKIYPKARDTYNDMLFIRESKEKILSLKGTGIGKNDDKLKEYFFKNYVPETESDILKFANGKLKKVCIDNINLDI